MPSGPNYLDAQGLLRPGEDGVSFSPVSDWLDDFLEPISDAIGDLRTVDDTGWIQPTLSAGATHETSNPLQYRRLRGIVYFRGRATPATTASGQTLFTLPVGFRPDGHAGAAGNNLYIADAGGSVRINIPTATGVVTTASTTTGAVSLSGITYVAAV